ncbi:hypothetical protein HUJ05_004043 [Dendroctonus ponderosae]|nr:hypothetical protein HUJ05_004043 [Dendroctonus ponderosae]
MMIDHLIHNRSLKLEFNRFDQLCQTFAIKNVNDSVHEIALKISSDITSFALTALSGNILQCSDEFKVTLNPEETVQVSVQFIPENYGTTSHSIPIFVGKFSETQAFNHLQLQEEYTQPRMTREITSPTASSPLIMSTAVVDETSGRNSHRPGLQSPENIPKCDLTGRKAFIV